MDKMNGGPGSPGFQLSTPAALALLDVKGKAADAGGDVASGVAAVRDTVEGRFGLSAEQRVAVVLESAGVIQTARAAAAAGVSEDRYRALLGEAHERLSATSAERAVILEDDWFGRRRLEDACSANGVTVAASTADPALAVAAAVAYRPGIALIDLEINGDQLAGEIAAMSISERSPGTRVVLVTGYDSADRIAALMPNTEALVKPVSSSALERVLKAPAADHTA